MTQETPLELNVTLANDGGQTDIESLDVELDVAPPMTRKAFNHYRAMLRIMNSIHNDIADAINEKRAAALKGFFRVEDEFIPETKQNDFYSLWLDIAAQDKVKQPLP